MENAKTPSKDAEIGRRVGDEMIKEIKESNEGERERYYMDVNT